MLKIGGSAGPARDPGRSAADRPPRRPPSRAAPPRAGRSPRADRAAASSCGRSRSDAREQVRPEALARDRRIQRPRRRRDEADVDLVGHRAPDGDHLALLHHAQQRALRGRAESATSSSSSVPRSAARTNPTESATAPENAPRTWPNSRLSARPVLERVAVDGDERPGAARALVNRARQRPPCRCLYSPTSRTLISARAARWSVSRSAATDGEQRPEPRRLARRSSRVEVGGGWSAG